MLEGLVTRMAAPEDDLSVLWPVLSRSRINRDNVVLVEDDTGIRGGALLFDGGHGFLFVGELTTVPPQGEPVLVKKLIDAVLLCAQSRGVSRVMFHCVEGSPFLAAAQKRGAQTTLASMRLVVFNVASYKNQMYPQEVMP